MIVTAKTVEAINGVRASGFYGGVKAMDTENGAYELVSVDDGAVKATVAADGTITYPATQQTAAVVPQGATNG